MAYIHKDPAFWLSGPRLMLIWRLESLVPTGLSNFGKNFGRCRIRVDTMFPTCLYTYIYIYTWLQYHTAEMYLDMKLAVV